MVEQRPKGAEVAGRGKPLVRNIGNEETKDVQITALRRDDSCSRYSGIWLSPSVLTYGGKPTATRCLVNAVRLPLFCSWQPPMFPLTFWCWRSYWRWCNRCRWRRGGSWSCTRRLTRAKVNTGIIKRFQVNHPITCTTIRASNSVTSLY